MIFCRKSILVFLCLCLLAFAAAADAAANPALKGAPEKLILRAGSPGSEWSLLGSAIGGVWAKEVLPTNCLMGGASANLAELRSGAADVVFTYIPFIETLQKRNELHPIPNAENVTVLATLFNQYLCFLARRDFLERNNIFLLSDIFDRKLPMRFATFPPGTGPESVARHMLRECYHVTYDTIQENGGRVDFVSYESGLEMFKEGKIDVFAFVIGKNVNSLRQLEGYVDYEILQIDNSALRALAREYGTTTAILEPGLHKGITIPVRTVGLPVCLAVRRDLPDDLVYELCKTLWRSKKELASFMKEVEDLSPATALPLNAPAHPGAERFWKEAAKSGK